MSRDEAAILEAKIRATIISLLKGYKEGMTSAELKNHDRIKKLEVSAFKMGNILKDMADNEQIFKYWPAKGRMVWVVEKPEQEEETQEESHSRTKANIKIDVIKKTGKVRLHIGGMCIEIGVV